MKDTKQVIITDLNCDKENNLVLIRYEGFEHDAKYNVIDSRVFQVIEKMKKSGYKDGQIKKVLVENGLIEKRKSAQDFLDDLLESL